MSKAGDLLLKCLDEMYQKSTPPITWDEVIKRYGGKKCDFYSKHAISEKDYEKIKEKCRKELKKRYGKLYEKDLDMILLNYSPTIKEWKNDHKSKRTK